VSVSLLRIVSMENFVVALQDTAQPTFSRILENANLGKGR